MLGLVSVSCCVMNQRKSDIALEEGGVTTSESRRASHASMREQKYIRNSSEDPAITTTRSERHVLSNARNHPRAELKTVSNQSSNHVYNHVNATKSYDSSINLHDSGTKSCDKRKRSHEDADGDVWTEHLSSTGRVYYYNKRLDKSQWESPKGFTKKPKLDLTPATKSHVKPTNQSNTMPSSNRMSASSKSSSRSHTGHSSSHKESSSSSSHHRDSYHHRESSGSHYRDGGSYSSKEYKESGYHRDGGLHQRGGHYHYDREKGRERVHSSHYSSRKHGSHSRSHSRSVSPTTSSSAHKGSRHGWDKSPTRLTKSTASSRTVATSPLASYSTKPTQVTPTPSGGGSSMTMVSPTTPVSIPASLSHTLSATQQIIDQTTLLIQQQQRIITGDGSSTVTPVLSTPLAPTMHGGTQSPMSQPHARHKLVYTSSSNTPYSSTATEGMGYIVSGGVVSGGITTPLSVTPGYITSGGVVSGVGNISSPQVSHLDTTGLHPLQKALLLQNQFTQQQVQAQPYQVADMTNLPLTPVPALPPHLTPQHSLPSSPLVQSPISIQQQVYGVSPFVQSPIPIQQQVYGVSPLTPIQSNVFTLPSQGGLYDSGSATPTNLVTVSSPLLSSPMSRLGYFEGSRVKEFPDASMLEALGQSKVDSELVSRSLAERWMVYNESMEKQMDSYILESLRRKTVDSIYQSGKLARCSLSVKGSQVRTQALHKRILNSKSLIEQIEKR